MDEKVIIKSEHYNAKKAKKIAVIIGIALAILCIVIALITIASNHSKAYDYYNRNYDQWYRTSQGHKEQGYCSFDKWDKTYERNCIDCRLVEEYDSASSYASNHLFSGAAEGVPLFIAVIIVPICLLIGTIIAKHLTNFELTVTDKRIYGTIKKRKRVDIPLDSISAVGTGRGKSFTVSSASGKISFCAIKNRNEIHEIVSKLLVDRQKQTETSATVACAPAASNADELKKYKELLDSGVITQEEFDAKKKQLLGL